MESFVDNESVQVYQKYLFKQVIAQDPVMLEYIKNEEHVTQEKIEKLYNFYNSIKNKRTMLEIGKGVVRCVFITTKNIVCESDNDKQTTVGKLINSTKPIFKFIEPENISTKLTNDENLALINNLIKRETVGKEANIYMLIGTNMLMSMISSNIKGLFDGELSSAKVLSDLDVSNLYSKIVTNNGTTTNPTPKRQYSDNESDNAFSYTNKRARIDEEELGFYYKQQQQQVDDYQAESNYPILSPSVSVPSPSVSIPPLSPPLSVSSPPPLILSSPPPPLPQSSPPIVAAVAEDSPTSFDLNSIFENHQDTSSITADEEVSSVTTKRETKIKKLLDEFKISANQQPQQQHKIDNTEYTSTFGKLLSFEN
ncbi:hypothetical protein HgNV_088 [Homarus gammarus nudivirus]|uniref:Uncharacterized protein n=1 Tax=Homarus gammarus nudivirus TaxID=2509616 RepID=A0A411HBE7_9VIRU|nr:hypothetical protein KM727_gp88 [Homarus gammarus nudivirus]QBB28693.1 hypothetical protein HgNV_088 [Homarus gammarus nudivirus]